MKSRPLLWFFLAQFVTCGFVFRAGLWGGSLLAPLDIAPALFSKYKFVDPESSAIPADHYDIDQLLADLPLQLIGVLGIGITGVRSMTGPRKSRVLLRQSLSPRE